jgi:hypothetical protein
MRCIPALDDVAATLEITGSIALEGAAIRELLFR